MKQVIFLLTLVSLSASAQFVGGRRSKPVDEGVVARATQFVTSAQLRAGVADTVKAVFLTDEGRSGVFVYQPGSSAIDDSSMVIVSGSRRYIRDSKEVFVEYFGAKADYDKTAGTGTDNTASFQKAVNYINSIGGGTLTASGGNYLISGTVYVNFNGSRPFTFSTSILNMKNSSAAKLGVTLVKNTSGAMWMVNIDANGNGFNGSSNQYPAFAMSGFNAIATVPGVVLCKQFRTVSKFRDISTDGFDWVVLQENTDAAGNGNYCDKSSYISIKAGNARIGALRLCKADNSTISDIKFEGDANNYANGLEIVTAKTVSINNILQWFASGSDVGFTPVSGSKLINIVNCTAVDISGVYVEHSPHEYLFNISGSKSVVIRGVDDKYTRRGGVQITGASKSIRLIDWTSNSDVLESYADIKVAIASPPITDITYSSFSLMNAASVSRGVIVDQDNINSVKKIQKVKDTEFIITDNVTLKPNSTYLLGTPTANKVATLPSFTNNMGEEIVLYNSNTSTFSWSFDQPVKDKNGQDLTILKPFSVTVIEASTTTNSGWRIKSEYVDPTMEIVSTGDANYTVSRANSALFVSTLTANRVITIPSASSYRGKRIIVFNGNATSNTLTSSATLSGLGFTTTTFQNQSSTSLLSDGANWRIEYVYTGTYSLQTTIATASGNGSSTTISIPHGLASTPSYFTAQANNAAASGISHVTADATNINIVYGTAPASGTNNLSYTISYKR